MKDIYKNIEDINLILIVFDKKLIPIVTELFNGGRKLNISLVFITKSYFAGPKNIALNFTHNFIMEISNKRELQQISFNYSSDHCSKSISIIIK